MFNVHVTGLSLVSLPDTKRIIWPNLVEEVFFKFTLCIVCSVLLFCSYTNTPTFFAFYVYGN